jgi:glycine cleavage system H protein
VAEYPTDLRYTKAHEWVRAEGDRWRMGITSFAAKQLGDVVFVELPKVGDKAEQSEALGTIESVKAVSEIYAPISGTVAAVNEALRDVPEAIYRDPHGEGWMIEITPSNRAQLEELLTAEAYGAFVAEAE